MDKKVIQEGAKKAVCNSVASLSGSCDSFQCVFTFLIRKTVLGNTTLVIHGSHGNFFGVGVSSGICLPFMYVLDHFILNGDAYFDSTFWCFDIFCFWSFGPVVKIAVTSPELEILKIFPPVLNDIARGIRFTHLFGRNPGAICYPDTSWNFCTHSQYQLKHLYSLSLRKKDIKTRSFALRWRLLPLTWMYEMIWFEKDNPTLIMVL